MGQSDMIPRGTIQCKVGPLTCGELAALRFDVAYPWNKEWPLGCAQVVKVVDN